MASRLVGLKPVLMRRIACAAMSARVGRRFNPAGVGNRFE